MIDIPAPRLYLDNAATSFPKPTIVHEAMAHYATNLGASPGRGAYRESRESGILLNECRTNINTLINGENPDHVIFTLNCSDALNIAIKGIVRPGDHVITTDLDHNSILRPFNALANQGIITQTRVKCDPQTARVDPQDVLNAITPKTRLIAMLQGSNVTGTLQPIEELGEALKAYENIRFLVDAAQTLGHYPVDVQKTGIDLLAAPGHKGLLGPLGTGFLYIRPGVEKQMTTLREGGTGSVSELDVQPDFMPDRFEPGSHNTIGLIGLNEGVKYILEQTPEALWAHECGCVKTMIESLTEWGAMPGFTFYGPQTVKHRMGVFSFRIDTADGRFKDPNDLANYLEQEYNILTRAGLHCAPGAHQTIGTHELGGTTRVSFGCYTSPQDVKYCCDALGQLCHQIADTAGV